jgi:hypothetical protein
MRNLLDTASIAQSLDGKRLMGSLHVPNQRIVSDQFGCKEAGYRVVVVGFVTTGDGDLAAPGAGDLASTKEYYAPRACFEYSRGDERVVPASERMRSDHTRPRDAGISVRSIVPVACALHAI